MTLTAVKTSRLIWWICLGAIAVLFLSVSRRLPEIAEILVSGDGDDLMRLLQVRDWLAGQSWFDTYQYRVLPPEGISIHWSRYVDVGIAAFLVPASWFLPPTQAEFAAIILWPTFLGCLAVLVIGHANNRLLGLPAAVGALVAFLTWGKLGGEFSAGRIDHHNLQMLIGAAIFYLSVLSGKPGLRGALAGGLTAFSLAVGLEMLPFLAVVWGMMVLRHAFDEAGVGTWLIGFCAAFAGAAPLLLIGQTPMSGWWVNHCDVLAPPLLGLAAVGIVATLVPVVFARTLPHPVLRIGMAVAILAGGLWLAAPLLLPCIAGPYADNSAAMREAIGNRVTEALPFSILFETRPELLFRILLPPVLIALLALGAAWVMRPRLSRGLTVALIQGFVVLFVGLAFAVLQIRAANLMSPAVPFLAGFLVHAFMAIPRDSGLRAPAALVMLLAVPATVESASRMIAGPPELPSTAGGSATSSGQADSLSLAFCRNHTAMAEIASLPKSIVFSSVNLGPAILIYTPHSVSSAGYHRSEASFWNGITAFEDRTKLRDGLASSRAEYLVICVGVGEESFITRMEADDWPDWLTEVTGARKTVRLFKVDKAALAREVANP